jgi:hypothetical protein
MGPSWLRHLDEAAEHSVFRFPAPIDHPVEVCTDGRMPYWTHTSETDKQSTS